MALLRERLQNQGLGNVGVLRTTRGAILAAAAALLLAACEAESPDRLVASAQQYLAAQDDRAAIIQLRNAVQQDPKHAQARFLLGRTLARTGDYATAEKELRRALEYGYPREQVHPALAEVLFRSGQAKLVVAELGDKQIADADGQARLKTSVGFAQLAQGDLEAARVAFDAALAARPGDPAARGGLARLAAVRRDFAGAERQVDEILAQHPDTVEVLFLKADLLAAQGRVADAIPVLTRLVTVDPRNAQGWTLLVANWIEAGDYTQARGRLDAMAKAVPGDVRIQYLEALLAFRTDQPAKARDAVQQVLRVAPDHLPSLLLGGAVDYEMGNYALAEDRMRKVLARDPANPSARQVLVATLLRTGQAARAEDVLAPALRNAPDDPRLLRLAGEVALSGNEIEKAVGYYDRAAAADRADASTRARLATARLASGDVDRGIKDLEAAARLDPKQYQVDLALVAVLLSRNEYDKALAAAEGLRKKQPDNPLTYNVIGGVQRAKGDRGAARESFERALKLVPAYVPALRNLAALDLQEKRPDQARARFDAVLAREPANEGALLALAEFQGRAGQPPRDVVATLERAIAANPASVPARLSLINYQMQRRDPKAAVAAAQAALSALPQDPAVLDALGQAQLAAGENAQAVQTFSRLVNVAPQAPASHLRLAQAYAATREYEPGIQALRKALQLRPGLVEAERPLVAMLAASGRQSEAINEARAVQRARPREAIGFALEGDALTSFKRHDEAPAAYREALKRQPSAALVIALYRAAAAAGKPAEGEQAAQSWMRQRPGAPEVPAFLAERDLQRGDFKGAARRYREVLNAQPDNVVALNNYAWSLQRLGDASALGYAERAYRLAPGNPAIADTYGWMLVGKGETRRGIEILSEAASRAPNAGEIRLHLARALLGAGDKGAARRELEAVAKVGSDDQRAEAQGLLAQL
jgi:putative PEP-CTERM system TPR-repeat lipoprotein